jgi:hypothetical protein
MLPATGSIEQSVREYQAKGAFGVLLRPIVGRL